MRNDSTAHGRHHPPHNFLDDTWHIVTGRVYHARRLLTPPGDKEIVRDQLKELVKEFKIQLSAWVILDNHYHVLVKSQDAKKLSRFFARWHGRTSFELNGLENKRGRQIWQNFWDTAIRTERDYWTRFNYIHHNPVKHGYVKQTPDWEFSSYRYYLSHKGQDWLADTSSQYPIIDFTDPRDAF